MHNETLHESNRFGREGYEMWLALASIVLAAAIAFNVFTLIQNQQ
jgi:hypothetical protein